MPVACQHCGSEAADSRTYCPSCRRRLRPRDGAVVSESGTAFASQETRAGRLQPPDPSKPPPGWRPETDPWVNPWAAPHPGDPVETAPPVHWRPGADPWLNPWRGQAPPSSVPRTLAYWTAASLAVIAAVAGWLMVSHLQRASLADLAATGGSVDSGSLRAADHHVTAASIAYLLALVGTAALFITWSYRIVRSVVDVRPASVRHSAGWAIGGWFVPIWSLFRPKQMIDDAWRGSVTPIQPERPAWYVHAWWATLLIGGFTTSTGGRLENGSLRAIASADRGQAVGLSILVIAALLAIVVVLKLTDRVSNLPEHARDDSPATHRRPLRAVGVALGGAMALVAASAGAAAATGPPDRHTAFVAPPVSTPVGVPTDTPTPEPTHAATDPPQRLLLPVPSGWTLRQDKVLSIDAFTKQFGHPAAVRDILVGDGFARTVQRKLDRLSPEQVADIEVWQFRGVDGASDFYDIYNRGNDPTANHDFAHVYDVPGVPGAQVFVGSRRDAVGYNFEVGVNRVGDVIVHIRVAGRGTVSRGLVDDLVLRETRLLSRSG